MIDYSAQSKQHQQKGQMSGSSSRNDGRMTFVTERFRSLVWAEPERVWAELTAIRRPLDWLYGMVIESTWESGASVTVGTDEKWGLVGEVLAVDRPHRLSYTLGYAVTDPSIFVTWELAHDTDTTTVRLTVDETQPHGDTSVDMESAWLPVIQSLTAILGDGTPTTTDRSTID